MRIMFYVIKGKKNKSLDLTCTFVGNVNVGIFSEINALIHS